MKQRLSLSLGGNFLRTASPLPLLVLFALPLFILSGGVRVLNKHEVSAMPGPVPQQNQNRHPRAFVLEGIYARDDERYTSKAPVEVYRNGQKLELRPGDELQEGDRIRSEPRVGSAIFSGASVVIYNIDGEPVLMVGHNMGVDFTLSKLGLRQSNGHVAQVEIINHSRFPPVVEMIEPSITADGAELALYKEDGTRERMATQKEVDNFAMQMDLDEDHPFRRDARLMRAGRIIKEGRKAAEQEYTEAESALKKDDENWRSQEQIAKPKDKQQPVREAEQQEKVLIPSVIHESEGGFEGTWTRQGNTFDAVWNNGAKATLTIEKFDQDQIVIKRDDTGASVSHNFKATYTGMLSGNSIVGGKVAYEQNGNKWAGTWSARW